MPKLIVKAKKMNVRRVLPGFLPDPEGIVGVVKENFVFDGEEVLQVPNPSLGKWYKDNNGHFYWGGGIQAVSTQDISADPRSSILHYDTFFSNLPASWLQAGGRGIKVAVLDKGFNPNHKDLRSNVTDTFNAVDGTKNVLSHEDHGSNVAGLISAKTTTASGVAGIAPFAGLSLIKIADSNGVIQPLFVKNGLAHAINNLDVDVINLSLSLDEDDYLLLRNDIVNLLQTADHKKILIVASAGENSRLLNSRPSILVPANEDSCLAVGTINEKFLTNNPSPSFHARLTYLMPNLPLTSCSSRGDEYSTISDSSMAAAVLTGVSALLLSHLGRRAEKKEVIETLNQHLSTFHIQTPLSNLTILKV